MSEGITPFKELTGGDNIALNRVALNHNQNISKNGIIDKVQQIQTKQILFHGDSKPDLNLDKKTKYGLQDKLENTCNQSKMDEETTQLQAGLKMPDHFEMDLFDVEGFRSYLDGGLVDHSENVLKQYKKCELMLKNEEMCG